MPSEVSTAGADQDLGRMVEELKRELIDGHRREAATAEVLRVISQSKADVQPVFDTIVRSAARLCDGLFSGLVQYDGELLHHVAQHNHTPEALAEVCRIYPARPTRALMPGRAILERAVVHIPDVERRSRVPAPSPVPGDRLAKRALRANASGGRSHRRHRGGAGRARAVL
jgi:hypothetical protein